MSQRLYLDYNSTSPLSESVIAFLRSGDLSFSNPASIHTSGKKAKKVITDTTRYLQSLYSIDDDIIYHSGATEALNTFFQLSKDELFIYTKSDHPALGDLATRHKSLGGEVICLDTKNSGEFDYEALINILHKTSKKSFLNITWVNNESGLVNDLIPIKEIKEKFSIEIHVDAVQSPGKILNWKDLGFYYDMISFSAHKFGALKGIGFSFVNSKFPFKSFIVGGGQQKGKRSGTENPLGIYTVKLALEDLQSVNDVEASYRFKESIKTLFKNTLGDQGEIVDSSASFSSNTIGLIFKNIKSDLCLIQFDLALIDISYGSACSSGNVTETQTLASMGYSSFQNNFIRLSFGPSDHTRSKEILKRLETLFLKLREL